MLRLRTCCGANDPCDLFRNMLSLLHSFGIEPEMNVDHLSYYFDFQLPKEWNLEYRTSFHREINENIEVDENVPFCICCGAIISPLKRKCCVRCKNTYSICRDCNRAKDLADCNFCANE